MEQEKVEPKIENFTCHNSHNRLMNYIILNEFVKAKREKRTDWAVRSSNWLRENFGINRTPGTILSMLSSIKNGSRSPICSSGFNGKDLDPQSRYEKDAMYARFEVYIHEFLNGISTFYVGLPANQLVCVAKKYDSIIACEFEKNMALYMMDLNRFVIDNPNVRVEPVNIFNYLEVTKNKFNVFDLDLMTSLTEIRIEKIVSVIKRTALDRAVVILVSIGGRHISTKEYEALMPTKFIYEIEKDGDWKIINAAPFCGNYRDLVIPMRYAITVIEREK